MDPAHGLAVADPGVLIRVVVGSVNVNKSQARCLRIHVLITATQKGNLA
jgi:hypothetical protein